MINQTEYMDIVNIQKHDLMRSAYWATEKNVYLEKKKTGEKNDHSLWRWLLGSSININETSTSNILVERDRKMDMRL